MIQSQFALVTHRVRHVLPVAVMAFSAAAGAATIVVTSRDPAGVGFNDPTPVAPVGGNTGTTLGEQRMIVYQHVANLWGQAIQSNVNITVSAGWEALSCTAGSAVLGSAGAWNVWRDFPGGVPNRWYPQALANKLADVNLIDGNPDDGTGYGNVDIKTQFNVNLGNTGCLDGRFFYLGLDGNAGTNVNFMTTLLHEIGHGLGFSILSTSTASGRRVNSTFTEFVETGGVPSYWEDYMYDNTIGKTWLDMSNAERAASAINPGNLVWIGVNSVAGVPTTLSGGLLPRLTISGAGAGAAAGDKVVGTASFGPQLTPNPITALLWPVVDQINGTGLACDPLAGPNLQVAGKIALVDRGTCAFTIKVKNAQNAGAIGVVVADNVVAAVTGLGGSDATVTIPSVRISKTDGQALRAAMARRSRSTTGVFGTLVAPPSGLYAGADALGRPKLYTPNPREPGSSVSHWDTSLTRNQLMEPFISSDLTTNLVPPFDLTVPLLKDLGW